MRSSLVPTRSCPEPAPSTPSRTVTVPSHELSTNSRCVAASATTSCTGTVTGAALTPLPCRGRGAAVPPSGPKKRASAGTSDRSIHRAGPPSAASHHRGGRSRRSITPPGVSTSSAPCRDTATVTRSATTRQPPSVSGSSPARGSGSGHAPASAYDGSGPAPSHPQNTAPFTATRIRSSERANLITPPPGPGSTSRTVPGTLARTGPGPVASAPRLRHAARTVRNPRAAPAPPTGHHERTRSRPFMLLTLPSTAPRKRGVQLLFTRDRTTSSRRGLCGGHPGAEVDHVASSLSAASRAHPSPCAEDAHDAHSPGAAPCRP